MVFFGIILTILTFGFGIVAQAALYPSNRTNTNLIKDIIHNAYWSIFGQLNIYEELYPKVDDVLCIQKALDGDPAGIEFTYVLLIFYILSIIVLMNVLIAMFK